MNAAHVIDIDERRRTARSGRGDAEIVGVILGDGSVRDLRDEGTERPADDFDAGQVSGDGWTLWWERRRW
jgi:hypothetical protein